MENVKNLKSSSGNKLRQILPQSAFSTHVNTHMVFVDCSFAGNGGELLDSVLSDGMLRARRRLLSRRWTTHWLTNNA
jgi:hypothetical protein